MSINDTVISSRIRLARNIKGLSFPKNYKQYETEAIYDFTFKAANAVKSVENCETLVLSSLSEIDRQSLVEMHLVSPNLLKNKFGSVVLSSDRKISVMLSEEDHIREQCITDGLNLNEAFNRLNRVDDALISALDIAFDNRFGFLTACPTNVGTGMRASVMMFLPALKMTHLLDDVIMKVARIGGYTFRGAYGEGSEAQGNVFQLSNSYTLGLSEKDIIDGVEKTAVQLVECEDKARKKLLAEMTIPLKDKICRSWGLITNAYIMSSSELMSLLSDVKLGIILGILPNYDIKKLDRLAVLSGAAMLCQGVGMLSPEERDIKRAAFVKKAINGD